MKHSVIPVVLFAYARPALLARVLACLHSERVPLIIAYVDGPKEPSASGVHQEVLSLLQAVDWTDLRLTVRNSNLGLGRSILSGVEEVSSQYEAFIVWEDDLVCTPGTYAWMCAALRAYADEPKVMSVSAWTHPRVQPLGVSNQVYFDGRAECWVWGAWRRSWIGMNEETALQKVRSLRERGESPHAYGGDLLPMAEEETRKNIWAVRWLYHHLQHGGLCLRPPWSMTDHIGFTEDATNCREVNWLSQPALPSAPAIPVAWPEPVVNPDCAAVWRRVSRQSLYGKLRSWLKRLLTRLGFLRD